MSKPLDLQAAYAPSSNPDWLQDFESATLSATLSLDAPLKVVSRWRDMLDSARQQWSQFIAIARDHDGKRYMVAWRLPDAPLFGAFLRFRFASIGSSRGAIEPTVCPCWCEVTIEGIPLQNRFQAFQAGLVFPSEWPAEEHPLSNGVLHLREGAIQLYEGRVNLRGFQLQRGHPYGLSTWLRFQGKALRVETFTADPEAAWPELSRAVTS